ncbi:PREDICTED: 60 kDa SS-A/Ro ribonucleoprotein-like [Polistes dominula]|uniref:60 kDa SS-A/Ro ribonucleoprotein-like n=1 Tax=Polistes dominula TaxID=743375 RepID=A0ABM1IGF0_POLDO|nr:PREDICTED: 60 kDa SS-A/Ro ribonucleoprotein-like [Polistes dominula]XP_015179286.1 PREDICTED: 60 kDa SS-A/Ro ribonucleoprotein-like [Polistes dominula]XP_015179287.1 PREDICTED: 60 kDa SS-A/Ro ribonucleoprotein-like [Polistes dominula]XP_015179289.1 PREDICTED: 60 kDa SS-A/Ro ribonucleoprotein-like [Polistes dominula]
MDATKASETNKEFKEKEYAFYSPEEQMSAFLYVGKELPLYLPENLIAHHYFLTIHLECIEKLAADENKSLLPVEIILKAFESNLVPHFETLIFALAVCCKQVYSENLRHAAYSLVGKICSLPEHFILFIKFISELSKRKISMEQPVNPGHGWGHGLRKTVNNWYLSKEPLELAKCVTRCKGRHGWKHKDIIKLSHPHPDTPEKEVILKYIMHGLDETKKSFGNNLNVQELIEYIERIENFKHCNDIVQAAGLLEKYELTLDHVPGHMLKSTEIWNSLVSTMDLDTLWRNLQRIHNLGLLKADAPIIDKIIDEITNKDRLAFSNIHPILVYITLQNYLHSGKPLSYEKRKMKVQAKKPYRPSPRPNSKIISALHQAFDLSFLNLKSTGLRYMITIDANKVMWGSKTSRNGTVNGADAGFLIAYTLSRCEKDVTVALFDIIDVDIVNLNQSLSFFSLSTTYQFKSKKDIRLSNPIKWASKQNYQYDVFINVVNDIVNYNECEENFEEYKKQMNLPNAKLINFVVSSSKAYKEDLYNKNILTIYGFDATVPMVIQAFAKSLF